MFFKIINLLPEICWKDEASSKTRDEPFTPCYMEIFKNRKNTQVHTILPWKKVDQQAINNNYFTLLISWLNILISEEYASTNAWFLCGYEINVTHQFPECHPVAYLYFYII